MQKCLWIKVKEEIKWYCWNLNNKGKGIGLYQDTVVTEIWTSIFCSGLTLEATDTDFHEQTSKCFFTHKMTARACLSFQWILTAISALEFYSLPAILQEPLWRGCVDTVHSQLAASRSRHNRTLDRRGSRYNGPQTIQFGFSDRIKEKVLENHNRNVTQIWKDSYATCCCKSNCPSGLIKTFWTFEH